MVKVWVSFRNAKVSLAERAGMVAILLEAGAAALIVVVFVVPRTN